MFVEEAVPQIAPVHCFSDYCGDMGAGLLLQAAIIGTLIVGALIMRRWRDMVLVAGVAWAAALILTFGRDFAQHDVLPPVDEPSLWMGIVFGYGMFLLYATVLHAIKRGVIWLAGYNAAST